LYAQIIVQIDAPIAQPLTYRIPEAMPLAIGDAVVVPFGAQQTVGYVVGVTDDCPPDIAAKVKPIAARIEDGEAFDHGLLELAQWVAEQTLCDLRDTLRLIAPDVMASQIRTTLRLADDWEEKLDGTRSVPQRETATALAALGGSAEPSKVAKAVGQAKIGPVIAELRKKGVLTETRTVKMPPSRRKVVRVLRLAVEADIAAEEASRLERGGAARQARLLRALVEAEGQRGTGFTVSGLAVGASAGAAARALSEKGLACYLEAPQRRDPFRFFGFVDQTPPALTDAQARAAQAIGRHVTAQDGRTLLLYGVTGSGKTEVYLDAVAQTLAHGRGALVLLPEIGLTAQVLDLFKARLGEEQVAVLHSALSLGERHDEWRRIRSGEARVVIGARSAVFAPVADLGLIILDEEHDGSYKQDTLPRYHARDVAQYRAQQTGAAVVLGSATPSLESFYKAETGVYEMLTLSARIADRPLPPVLIVDLREEMKPKERPKRRLKNDEPAPEPPPPSVLGTTLSDAIRQRLDRREQVILFLNRRGFASFLLCRDCGFTFRCPNCDVSLTYHHGVALLQCHHCDHQRRAPEACPKCSGLRLRPFGLGTERVEQAVAQNFPTARVLRMDRDTMARKGAHTEALRAFRRGDFDILVGTQMIAKGLDFPNVTLVGVVSADTALNIPDFRSGERAFQLLTQVAGRAGRGKTPGEVIVQTFTPEHESILRASEHDYLGFYADALPQRRELGYPPFSHMANAVFSDEDEGLTRNRAQTLADTLRRVIDEDGTNAQILGPVACPLSRLRGRYRWHLAVRCPDKPAMLGLLRRALGVLSTADRSGLSLDIDPLSML
jgi:primosomal protein N' (replication factor Y)